MWKKQIILCCFILWIGDSLAKSIRPTSFDYDFRDDSTRQSMNRYRGKSATTPRPTFQEYWQSFVRSIPTLPPMRWNMTNSLSNFFNAGAQQIMETPVGMNHQMMDNPEPNRKRKSSKRKSSTKKNKNRKRTQSSDQSRYNDYSSYSQSAGYQQIQLQPLGVDAHNIMHFYEPKSGQYYAMQMVSGPPNIHNYNHNSNTDYYNNHQEQQSYEDSNDDDDNDDTYYNEDGYGDGHYDEDEHEHYSHGNEHYDEDENEHNNEYDADPESGETAGYADDVVVADNWGYTDDEVFGDRKLKGSLELIKPSMEEKETTVKIQKNLLKPETEADVMMLLSIGQQQTKPKRIKQNLNKEATDDKVEESARDVLGTFMKDDRLNRRIQSANTKHSTRLVEKPRGKYYIFPANFWL